MVLSRGGVSLHELPLPESEGRDSREAEIMHAAYNMKASLGTTGCLVI